MKKNCKQFVPGMFYAEIHEVSIAGSVHGRDKHLTDLLGFHLCTFKQLIPMLPLPSSFLLIKIKTSFDKNVSKIPTVKFYFAMMKK